LLRQVKEGVQTDIYHIGPRDTSPVASETSPGRGTGNTFRINQERLKGGGFTSMYVHEFTLHRHVY